MVKRRDLMLHLLRLGGSTERHEEIRTNPERIKIETEKIRRLDLEELRFFTL